MKCSIPEISWHNREPVLSVDVQPAATPTEFYRIATGGSDNSVFIWKAIIAATGAITISVLSELTRHQRSVNVVKFSPNGELLASGDDDANIILWQLRTDSIPSLEEHENEFEERWTVHKVLRGHKEDVYDICWSPNSDKVLSGSVDNSAIVWDVSKGSSECILKDHKGFVQGVAWDPHNEYLATLCSDRICRVFEKNGRRVHARLGKGTLPVSETSEYFEKEVKYFHDDTFKTYFRRLCFTPDGSLLLVPSGAVETDEKKNALFGTFAFSFDAINKPVCVFPSGSKCSIVVRCSPILYELHENGPKPVIDLPYRMIIAVATDSDVILYDTQQLAPCVHMQNMHYTRLTDLSWSSDGLLLTASSTDGYITMVTFEEGELGTKYIPEVVMDVETSVPEKINTSVCEEEPKTIEIVELNPVSKPKKPSFLEQWAKQGTPKSKLSENSNVVEPEKNLKVEKAVSTPTRKRITPILISKEVSNVCVDLTTGAPEVKEKKRIQPIKIAEIEKPQSIKLDEVEKPDNLLIEINKPVKTPTKCIDLTKPAPKTATPSGDSSVKKPSSSSKKKKSSNTPSSNNTLLKYLKPIQKTTTSELKPVDLFSAKTAEPEPVNNITLNTSNLIKTRKKSMEEPIVHCSEDTTELMKDFTLQVEDSVTADDIEKPQQPQTTEKENNEADSLKVADSNKRRRIPLITLSSPKAKKAK